MKRFLLLFALTAFFCSAVFAQPGAPANQAKQKPTLPVKQTSGKDDYLYRNLFEGGMVKFTFQWNPSDDHTLVVLKDPHTKKVGVWHNSYIFYSDRPSSPSHMKVWGFWVLKPEYDDIILGLIKTGSGKSSHAYALVCKEMEKRDKKWKEWEVYSVGLGAFCDKGRADLISPFKATRVEYDLDWGFVVLTKEDRDGNEKSGLWEIDLNKNKNGIKGVKLVEKIPPQYTVLSIPYSAKNLWCCATKEKGGNFGILSAKSNEEVFPFDYERVQMGHYGIAVRKDGGNGKYAVISFEDKSITDFIYDEVPNKVKEGFIFRMGDKYGFRTYTEFGKTVLEPQYDTIIREVMDPEIINKAYDGPVLFAKRNNKWGVYSPEGTCIMPEMLVDYNKRFYYMGTLPSQSYTFATAKQVEQLKNTKGEFETTEQFELRRNDPQREAEYLENALSSYAKEFIVQKVKAAAAAPGGINIKFGTYNMDNQKFPFVCSVSALPIYELSVPYEEGPAFKEASTTLKTKEILETASFFICDSFVQVAEITFALPNGKSYHYTNPGLASNRGPVVKYTDLF